MILAVMYREYLIRTTTLTWAFYDLFIPVTYLLLFGLGLDRAVGSGLSIAGKQVGYSAFFLPGVLAMASFGIAINTSYGFFVDRDNGIFYEFLTYPMTRGEFLIGKILFNCLLSVVQAMITVTLGALFLQIPIQWAFTSLLLAGVVIGTSGWFFCLTTFALRIRRNDMFNTFLNVAYFVLMFASSMFYPLQGLPPWLQVVAWANPLTWHCDVLRFITIGVGSMGTVIVEALAFNLFLIVSFAGAVHTLRRGVLG